MIISWVAAYWCDMSLVGYNFLATYKVYIKLKTKVSYCREAFRFTEALSSNWCFDEFLFSLFLVTVLYVT